jgi:hypothetical protein
MQQYNQVDTNKIFFQGSNPICANPCLGDAAVWQAD